MTFRFALVILILISAIALADFVSCKKNAGDDTNGEKESQSQSSSKETTSKKPLNPDGLFILYSYDLNGKMETCGCSTLQLGGLARRGTLYDDYRNNYGRHILTLDGGKLLPDTSEFSLLKSDIVFRMYNLMKYDALKLGSYEYSFNWAVLEKWADGANFPFVSSNVLTSESGAKTLIRKKALENAGSEDVTASLTASDFYKSVTGKVFNGNLSWAASPVIFIKKGNFRIGILAATEPAWVESLGPDSLVTLPMRDALKHLVVKFKDRADIWVAMIEGHNESVQSIAAGLPEISIWLSGNPRYGEAQVAKGKVGNDQFWMNIYQDGKYVGVTSIDKNGDDFFISQNEVGVMDTIKERGDLLAVMVNDYRPKLEGIFQNQTQPIGKEYVYSQACQKCHVDEYKAFEASHHFKSQSSLEKKGQQWNPDCVSCHIEYDSVNDRALSMQCTTCHYNAWNNHIDEARNNPAAVTPLSETINFGYCIRCHDEENSTEFNDRYREYFAKIKHWPGPTVPGEDD